MNHISLPTAALCTLLGTATALFAQPSLTIYNQDFAVVRDDVPLDLKAGTQTAIYTGATTTLEPDSVILRDPKGKVELQILEQSYRNDPLTQEYLLSLFEGEEIEFQVYVSEGKHDIVKGKVVRSGFVRPGQTQPGTGEAVGYIPPVIEVNGKLQFSLPGLPLFPSLGNDTILEPQLEWKLNASADAKINAEVAYLTRGMSWEADYNLVAPEKGDTVDIIGWVTMKNQTGKHFRDAAVKLMAGDLNLVREQHNMMKRGFAITASMPMSDSVVTEKSFDEYHLYTLQNPISLRPQETKQVEFVRATGVKAKRLYVYNALQIPPHGGYYVGEDPGYGSNANTKVTVIREFKNTKENQLGIPLPKGKLRFYMQDDDRRLEFTGENTIDHTAKDETIRVATGQAFDLVGARTRTDWKLESRARTAQESVEITVRNRKEEPAEVIVRDALPRWANWEIVEKSANFEKKNAQEIEFKLDLKPGEEGKITYRVRYTW